MKNTTLLKVLSATAIFSAVAAIEAYDQDSFAFAADETPVVANTTTSSTKPTTTQPTAIASTTGETNSPATPAANSAAAPATTSVTAPTTTAPKAEEPATVAQDVKALKDGEYKITAEALKFHEEGRPSMAAAAIDNEKTKLIVKNGEYSVNVSFKPITFGGLTGYLGDLKYYDGDKTHANREEIKDHEFKDSTIVENYRTNETDNFIEAYKEKFPNRTAYPKTVNYHVDKNKIDSNNKLETYTEVFVPVMASINPAFGTQKMTLKFDLTSLSRTKVTADNYEAATYKNPNKDVEYTGKINKEFPIHVQGHFRNANNNDEESLYGSALDSYVKIEKVGDKYKYTLRFKKGLADVGGEFYPFELHKVAYEGKDIPLTTLATNGNSSIKEGSITTDKLLEKIQLDGTAPYPNGALMSHFVTLKLYYETATPYKERPAKIEDVVAPTKPKPVKPTPTKPKEEPKPATPTAADHAVAADKVPNTFPTTVKAELNGRTTDTASIYENAFVKDVKVEKVGDKYQYTIQVKEGKSTNFLLRNKPFTVSKLTYKGNEISFTEVDEATKLKEGKILTDSLLDKIQVDAVMSVRTKGGAKPRYEERAAESTITLDFPTVEKAKEETANNSVPAKIYDASVADKLSMSDGALVHEKTRVEKVNDTYHYYLTFKDLNVKSLIGTVDTLTVDGTAAQRSDLGGESHEKVFHFTSPEKLTEKTITFSVSVAGKPLRGHSNVAATLKFNWGNATPLTADQVTSLHKDETTKAQAEKERLEKEAAKAQAEKERLEKEEAARIQAEKERLEKEKAQKAEADRLEKERLEKEAAAKAQAEKERLEKEKALKEAIEKVQAENKKAEEEAKAAKDAVANLETDKAQLEKLVKEKEAAINNATTEAEKEKLATEKATAEKELTTKVTELKTATEKEVKLRNKVDEIKKLEEVKNEAVKDIANDKSLSKDEAKQLEAIVKTASLKDTLVAKVEGTTEEIKVSFDNTAVKASNLVVKKADTETVAKVEKLAKKADGNLNVVKTIDLHFEDSNHNIINKQGETLTVTVAVVANEGEKLEVYYVNGDKLEKVPSVYKDGKLTFFANHFSSYTIIKEGKTVPSNQNTPVPVTPAPSDKNEEIKSDKGEALVQEELPALDLNKVLNETTQKDSLNILGQTDNKEIKDNDNLDVVKTNNQVTSATPVNTVKKGLANTGLASTATAGLGALVLLSALVLRRKFNK